MAITMMQRCRLRRVLTSLLLVVLVVGIYLVAETGKETVIPTCTECDSVEQVYPTDQSTAFTDRRDRSSEAGSRANDIARIIRDETQKTAIPETEFVAVEDIGPDAKATSKATDLIPVTVQPTKSHEVSVVTGKITPVPTVDGNSRFGVTGLNPSDNGCSASLLSDDGFIRHCITGDIVGKVPADLRTALFRAVKGISPETEEDRKQSFKRVFDTRAWGHSWDAQNKGLNASGMGATLYWTQETMAILHVIINQLKQSLGLSRIRLLDVPCGDMAWMSRFLKTRDDIDYTGIDIVPALIEHHRQVFKAYPWKFQLKDFVSSSLNESYHLILCRTLLQHLFYHEASAVLERISASGSGYLLLTSFSQHSENEDLVINGENPGRFRKLNLELKPFSLVPPLCTFRDGPPDVFEGWDHFLSFWKLPLRKVRHCKRPSAFEFYKTKVKIYSCTNWMLT